MGAVWSRPARGTPASAHRDVTNLILHSVDRDQRYKEIKRRETQTFVYKFRV